MTPEEKIARFVTNLRQALEDEGHDNPLAYHATLAAVSAATAYYLKGQ